MDLARFLVETPILQKALDLMKGKKAGKVQKLLYRYRNGKLETYQAWVNPNDKETDAAVKEGLAWEYSDKPQVNTARIKAAREKKQRQKAAEEEARLAEQRKQQEKEEAAKREKEQFENDVPKFNALRKKSRRELTLDDILFINNHYQQRIKYGVQTTKTAQHYLDEHKPGNEKYEARVARGQQTSIITLTVEECQELIDKYAGTGEVVISARSYPDQFQEKIVRCGKIVGINRSASGKEQETDSFVIHYGKDGCHIVPCIA